MVAAFGGLFGAIGGAVSAAAAVLGGIQQANMMRYQAEMAERQAQIERENAVRAVERAQIEAEDQDRISLAFLGEQEAFMSASGLSGQSHQLARKGSREIARRDALNIRQAGDVDKYNFQQRAINAQAEAGMLRSGSRNALLSGFVGGATSLISAAQPVRSPKRFQTSVRVAV